MRVAFNIKLNRNDGEKNKETGEWRLNMTNFSILLPKESEAFLTIWLWNLRDKTDGGELKRT